MPSIQSSPYPLVFPVAAAAAMPAGEVRLDRVKVRAFARALEGMQKEAHVPPEPTGPTWRHKP